MLEYVIGTKDMSGLTPHRVKESHSVLEARRVLAILQEPLARITCNIEFNIKLIDEHLVSLREIEEDLKELEKMSTIQVTEIETKELSVPRLVCMSQRCSKTYDVYGEKVTVNKTCHEECNEIGAITKIGDRKIKDCYQFKWWTFCRKCDRCGCHYRRHTQTYTETKIIKRSLEDENIKSLFNDKIAAKVCKQMMIHSIQELLTEVEEEKKFVMETAAKFATFIKANAIVPHNDTYKVNIELLDETSIEVVPFANVFVITYVDKPRFWCHLW